MRYYSCDSHLVEPRTVFEGLDGRFGTRAPQVVRSFRGRPGDYVVFPDPSGRPFPVPVGRLGIAGMKLHDPEAQERIAQGYDGLNPGVADPVLRLADQDRDGIVGEVMYPSINMFTFSLQDREVAHEIFRRHNDYCVDYCAADPERLIGIGCLPLPDVDEALAEVVRAGERGVRGFAIPAQLPHERSYRHPDLDPFWAAVQDLDVPLTVHIFTGASWGMGLPAYWDEVKSYTFSHVAVCESVIDLICGGVVERFPRLKFVVSEFETGWLAHFLQRLDHAFYRSPSYVDSPLAMKPSEYFRRNFWATFEDDLQGVQTRHGIGVDRLLWGNDYPHHDAIWPHSMEVLSRVMEGVPAEEVEQMCWSNVVDLYRIDTSKLPA